MKNKRTCFLRFFLFLFVFLLRLNILSAEISLTIIGEEKKISKGLVEGLEKYLPQFNHVYYNYQDSKIQNILRELSLDYYPVVIYQEEKLNDSD
ncbi:MAG: hypothetical protein P9M06_07705, partial [Candidatus Saelkia tenebricola]|nr:hypothetical protein [Candidatus Saelkia tenebricola]